MHTAGQIVHHVAWGAYTYLLAHFNRAATPPRKKHLVASFDAHGDDLALCSDSAGTGGDHMGLREGGLGRRAWEEQAGRRLGLGLEALDQHAVQEGHNALDRLDRGRHDGCGGGWWGKEGTSTRRRRRNTAEFLRC